MEHRAHRLLLLLVLTLAACGERAEEAAEQQPPTTPAPAPERKPERKAEQPGVNANALRVLVGQLERKPQAAPFVVTGQPPAVRPSEEELAVIRRAGRLLAVGTRKKTERLPLLLAAGGNQSALVRRRALLMIEPSHGSRTAHRNGTIPLLVERTGDADPQVRVAAALKLVEIHEKSTRVIDRLSAALRDPERLLRLAAVQALQAIGPRAACALLPATGDEDAGVAARARAATVELVPPVALTDGLAALLGHASAEVRWGAARLLCRMGVKLAQARLVLLEAVVRHPDEALVLLARTDVDDRTLCDLLYRALMGSGAGGRQTVAQVLKAGRSPGALLERLAAALSAADPAARLKALEGLAGIGPQAAPAMIGALVHSDPQLRSRAAEALASMGGGAAPALAAALERGSEKQRLAAAMVLARTPTVDARKAQPVLERALTHPERQTRIEAARLLGALGKNDVSRGALLVRAAAKDKTLRSAVAAATAEWSEAARLRLFDALARGGEVYERWVAYSGWTALKQYDKLVALLADGDAGLAGAVRRTLTGGQDKAKAGDALLAGLTHAEAAVRIEAAHALLSITPDRTFGTSKVRRGIPVLVAALGEKEAAVRRRALERLVGIQPSTSQIVQALGGRVAEDPDTAIADAAAAALKKYGTSARAAIGSLARGLNHSEPAVRKRVLVALGAIGPAARGVIKRATRDKDPEVKALATELMQSGQGGR